MLQAFVGLSKGSPPKLMTEMQLRRPFQAHDPRPCNWYPCMCYVSIYARVFFAI